MAFPERLGVIVNRNSVSHQYLYCKPGQQGLVCVCVCARARARARACNEEADLSQMLRSKQRCNQW